MEGAAGTGAVSGTSETVDFVAKLGLGCLGVIIATDSRGVETFVGFVGFLGPACC